MVKKHRSFRLAALVVAVAISAPPSQAGEQHPPARKPYAGHPRLFFDGPAASNSLLKNMSPAKAAIWQGVLKATAPKVEAGSGRQFGRRLGACALVYGISGDRAYLQGARAGLLRGISDDMLWGGERLNRAEMLYGIAVAYDCTYHDLSDAERLQVRRRLVEELPRALKGSWTIRPISNQTWVSCAALACAAYGIRGEDPAAEAWTKYAIERLQEHVMLRATDGTPSNEGMQYGAYEGIWGLIHRTVIERGEQARPKVLDDDEAAGFTANYGRFWLHASVPGHRFWLDYGDSHGRTKALHPVSQALAYYAALYQRQGRTSEASVTEWFRQRRLAVNGDSGEFTPFHFLWYTDGIAAMSPEGKVPLVGHFRDLECHIFRESWEDPKAGWFAFKCSPQPSHTFWKVDPQGKTWESTGHGHPDTGHFSLVADGQWLAVDDGYGGSTVAQHNTLVIDGARQLGDKGGGSFSYRPEKFPALAKVDVFGEVDSGAGHFLTGDMTAAYPNATLVHRHVLVLRQPLRIVMADVIQGGERVDWLLHTDKQADIRELGPGHLFVQTGEANMRLQTALPAKPLVSIEPGARNSRKITLTAPVASTPFLVALLPGRAASKPAVSKPDGFTFPGGETVTWNFDKGATLCLAEGPNGLVAGLASRLDLPWLTLRSSRPVNLSIDKNGAGTIAVPPGGDKATVHLEVKGRPARQFSVAPDSYAEVVPD